MTATLHLVCGPARSGKTQRLLEKALAQTRREPGSVLWLVPSVHALAELRSRLMQHGAVVGLRLASFAELVAALLEDQRAELLSESQRRLIVEEIIAELTAAGQLGHLGRVGETAGFADRFLALVDELRSADVEPTAFAHAARGPRDRETALLYRRYDEILRAQGRHDLAQREFLAARSIVGSTTPLLEGVGWVFVDGVNSFTPGQRRLIEALAEHVHEVYLTLLDESGDDRAELLALPRQERAWLVERGASVVALPWVQRGAQTPAGLAHLGEQLFRPLRRVVQADDATGVSIVRAPGLVGEVRLVARQVKQLLLGGVAVSQIDLVVREMSTYADLLRDLFADHGIPLEMETRSSLLRQPGIALLVRAVRLADDEFPFAEVTALLRHSCFHPLWADRDDLPQLAEALLRLLAVPRGKEAYLAAVERWAERVQPGLEDETAEETRRQRIHELARTCQTFLGRFFRAWDDAPPRASLEEHVAWLRGFVAELGLARDERDHTAWQAFWNEIEAWKQRDYSMDRRIFHRRLAALAARTALATPRGNLASVVVLSPEQARYRKCDHRFILGLGERTYPRPSGGPSLRDEILNETADTFVGEMLLFHEVVTGAQRQLTLSYPAVDERGQELLPGSFLHAVEACFVPGSIPSQQRRMLIEGYFDDIPLSPSEYRAQVGASWPLGAERLDDRLRANLFDAVQLVQARFHERGFTAYDGMFQDPFLIGWVGRLFGPQRIFSPTALEDYIACPFRFFLGHVLHLEPLEEPGGEVEVTRRGMVVHRALARLHQRLREEGRHHPGEGVEDEVLRELSLAIDEDVSRAPGLAARALWRLEGQRLLQAARRYPGHWGKFVKPWLERGVAPRPHYFEIDFGLPAAAGASPADPLVLRHREVEVRVWGRIDRVDLAELEDGVGFWIIDYKTGRSAHYTATDLAEFRKVQLTLYAVAVEAVFLQGQKARPLGLAYWLVSESGPKVVLPGRNATAWLEETTRWPAIRAQLIEWVTTLARQIRRGAFPLAPRSEHCTQTCPFGQICRITQARAVGKTWELSLPGCEEKEA